MKTQNIPFDQLNLSKQAVLCEMGYGSVEPDPYVSSLVDSLFLQLAKQSGQYTYATIDHCTLNETSVLLNQVEINAGKTICSLLENSISFVIFAATAGTEYQTILDKVKTEDDLVKEYVLDVIGSCIAEKLGDLIEAELNNQIHTHRFSPGYCGWNLKDQSKIFALLGGNPCNIQLSDVYLMHPIKSISGIIGVGPHVNQRMYGCNVCELTTCYKRKQKKQ